MNRLSRRALLSAPALLAACGTRTQEAGCAALAGKTIRWIVPYGAGGSYDTYSRLIEPPFEQILGAEIVILNETGASSLVGASKIRSAPPDGLTLGFFNAPGLLAAHLLGQAHHPDPAGDFTILGRLARSQKAIATRAQSPFRTLDELAAYQRESRKPLLCGSTGLSSDNFINLAVVGHLLGLDQEFLFGHSGSREELLAALRGDVDLISLNYETIQPAVESGDLRVLLQCSDQPMSPHPALRDVPLLLGPGGAAARRAAALGRSPADAVDEARGLIQFIGCGMVAAAPSGLPEPLRDCLREAMFAAARTPAFQEAAARSRRTLDVAAGGPAHDELIAARASARRFLPILRAAAGKVRN
jgi:tripartite-type tricarboxylate transporter receptor subunit TctC